jgi:hypothetical protein
LPLLFANSRCVIRQSRQSPTLSRGRCHKERGKLEKLGVDEEEMAVLISMDGQRIIEVPADEITDAPY